MNILILEDDPAQLQMLSQWLNENGHPVVGCASLAEFYLQIKQSVPDLIILDWELGDGNGLDALKHVRQTLQSDTPVLFTTQRDSEVDIVSALKQGADDYLVKPLRIGETLARVTALGRRAGVHKATLLQLGPISIDTEQRQVLRNSERLKLTEKDYQVLLCLVENLGKVLSREFLLKTVWGLHAQVNTRTVDMHISRVRRSAGITPDIGYRIKNVYQHGYRLEAVNIEAPTTDQAH